MKKYTRDETENGQKYYLASEVDKALAQPAQGPDQGPVFNKLLAYVCNVPDDGIYAGELYQERHSLIDEAKAALAQDETGSSRAAQEPVAVVTGKFTRVDIDLPIGTPLYTTPQQRPWVGLTEAQFLEAVRLAENGNYLVAFVRIQEWLKELNQ